MKAMALGIPFLLTLSVAAGAAPSAYVDKPFVQDYSEKIPLAAQVAGAKLLKVRMDRNSRIVVLSDKGLLQIDAGLLKSDRQHRPLADANIKDMEVVDGQFMYRTDHEILSNAGAGQILTDTAERHPRP